MPEESGRARSGAWGWLVLASLAAVGFALAWFAMWSSPLAHDESYLLLTLREWVTRGHLYDHVYSQYGPFYYLAFGLPARVFGVTWTIDAGRFTNLGLWCATAFLFGVAGWKLTARLGFGIAAFVLTFSMLNTLVNEPMHPGALLCVLLALLLANITALRPALPRTSDALSGVLAAALTLTKLNVGMLASVALVFVAVEGLRGRGDRWWRAAGITAFVAAGPVLLLSNGAEAWKVQVAALYVAAAVAVVFASNMWRARTDGGDPRIFVGRLVAGFAGAAVVILGFALVTGTTLTGLTRGIVTRPLKFSTQVTVPIEPPGFTWLWLVVVPLGFLAWRRLAAWPNRQGAAAISAAVRIAGGAALVAFVLGPATTFGYVTEGGGLRFSLLPLAALVLLPPLGAGSPAPGALVARRFLAAAAVTESLHAYPVPGSQVSWSLLLAALSGAVAVSDGVSELLAAGYFAGARARRGAVVAGAALVLLIPLVLPAGVSDSAGAPGAQFADWVGDYRDRVPTGIPAAGRVRTLPADRRTLRRLTALTRRHCRRFVAVSVNDATYLLTGLDPPTGFNAPVWQAFLRADEQQAIVRAVRDRPGTCLLLAHRSGRRTPDGHVVFTVPMPDRPLVRYLESSRWAPVGDVNSVAVLRRV